MSGVRNERNGLQTLWVRAACEWSKGGAKRSLIPSPREKAFCSYVGQKTNGDTFKNQFIKSRLVFLPGARIDGFFDFRVGMACRLKKGDKPQPAATSRRAY
jgi:hypothetical protein